MPVTYH